MKQSNPLPPNEKSPPEPDLQQGHGRSIARDEQLKRVIRQHPQRDEPKVDSVGPDETPPPP
jgi:hypothetical protein